MDRSISIMAQTCSLLDPSSIYPWLSMYQSVYRFIDRFIDLSLDLFFYRSLSLYIYIYVSIDVNHCRLISCMAPLYIYIYIGFLGAWILSRPLKRKTFTSSRFNLFNSRRVSLIPPMAGQWFTVSLKVEVNHISISRATLPNNRKSVRKQRR